MKIYKKPIKVRARLWKNGSNLEKSEGEVLLVSVACHERCRQVGKHNGTLVQ